MDTLGNYTEALQRRNISLRECINMHTPHFSILQKLAEEVLGVHYQPLKRFYTNILFSMEYEYIVFVARRSIALAELFFVILWNETESEWNKNYLEESWARVTTDSTILSYAGQIAQEIKSGHHPKILIVDDVLVQGNGLNELLSAIEDNVMGKLRELDATDITLERWREVVNTIHIRIFAQNNKLSVVNLQYQLKLKPAYKMGPQAWHDLSRRISNMIIATGLANATFIMGAEIFSTSEDDYTSIETLVNGKLLVDSETVITPKSYNVGKLTERHYFGWSRSNSNRISYFCSLRVIKNCYTAGYRLMPFVFLPQLSEKSYKLLKNRICEKWGMSKENNILNPNQDTSRLEYEIMLLHLSESLLTCWTKAAGIQLKKEYFDPLKVSLNYTINRIQPMIDSFEFMRLTNPAYLFSWDELKAVLDEATADAPTFDVRVAGEFGDPRRYLEDFVYETKIQELMESYRYYNSMRPSDLWSTGFSLQENRTRNWHIALEDFVNRAKQLICDSSLESIICNLLSFMDEGIVTLKVRKHGNSHTQVLRMGEQSLFVWPKRYDKYHPVLSYLEERSVRSRRSLREDLLDFLQYAQRINEISSEENVETLTDELISYLRSLYESGQELEDWDIDFAEPVVLDRRDKQWLRRVGSYCIAQQMEDIPRWIDKRKLFDACVEFYPS